MNFQTLERRRLLSVTVVEGYPGFFEVYGDDEPNAVAISIAADSTFTLDGVQYGAANFIAIFTFDGNDTVTVAADGETSVGAGVTAGAGDDVVTLSVSGAVWGEDGDDTLRIENSFRGELYGGPGDDGLVIVGACADAEIDGAGGDDWIDASGSDYGLVLRGGDGNDTVFGSQHDDSIYGEQGCDMLFGSGGSDVFYAADFEQDRIIGGAGVDLAYADAAETGVWGVEYVFFV
jgi:Ca2+-binding RTX toxin-like protein